MTLSAPDDVRAIVVFTDLRIVCVLVGVENYLIVISYVDGLANNFVICQNEDVNESEYEAPPIVVS